MIETGVVKSNITFEVNAYVGGTLKLSANMQKQESEGFHNTIVTYILYLLSYKQGLGVGVGGVGTF